MFPKIKNKIRKQMNKVSNYVFSPLLCSTIHHTGTSQTDLLCVKVHCSQSVKVHWFLYNRQTLRSKGLVTAAIISTYLQPVHVYLITCQFLVILGLTHFGFGSFVIESET